jgi:hypothetical protein
MQGVPEFASGELILHHCEVKRLRLRDEGYWRGSYLLTVAGLSQGEPQIIPVQGTLLPPGFTEPAPLDSVVPFAVEGWCCYLPELRLELRTQPPETELPALQRLTDPEAARILLEQSIGAVPANHELHIHSCTLKIMRAKPGSRCTILYQLTYSPAVSGVRHWPATVVAKTYHGDKGQNAYEGMQALWHSPLAASRNVTIAEPLAYLPDSKVLVQGPIREEKTLKTLLRAALRSHTPELMDELYAYLRKTAIGLAELHRSGVGYGHPITLANEVADLREQCTQLAISLPQLANLVTPLLAYLESWAIQYPADPPAPAHRSFRPAQVLLYQGEIGFIDFDGFCQAEPAMDLALFMTTVKNLGLNTTIDERDEGNDGEGDGEENEEGHREPPVEQAVRLARLAQTQAITDLFLTEYEKHAPVSRPRIWLWETLDLLGLLLGSWTKLKLARLDNCLFMLEQHWNEKV